MPTNLASIKKRGQAEVLNQDLLVRIDNDADHDPESTSMLYFNDDTEESDSDNDYSISESAQLSRSNSNIDNGKFDTRITADGSSTCFACCGFELRCPRLLTSFFFCIVSLFCIVAIFISLDLFFRFDFQCKNIVKKCGTTSINGLSWKTIKKDFGNDDSSFHKIQSEDCRKTVKNSYLTKYHFPHPYKVEKYYNEKDKVQAQSCMNALILYEEVEAPEDTKEGYKVMRKVLGL